MFSACVVGMFVRQNCGGQLGAASGLKTPAFTSISTDRRRWWIQKRISIRKPALPVDMNSPMRRCRLTKTLPSAYSPFAVFLQYLLLSDINLPHIL